MQPWKLQDGAPRGCTPLNPPTHPPTPQGRPYRALIADSEGATLPARGAPVTDDAEAELVTQLAAHLGSVAAGGAPGGGGGGGDAGLAAAPSAASLASSMAESVSWLENPSFEQSRRSTAD